MDTPVLWQFTSSHFNEKARWALDFKRLPHVRNSLVPGFHGATVKAMSGATHVPVLKLNGEIFGDSSKIIEALERTFPQPALYPDDPAERRRALEVEDFFDEELGPYIRRWIFHMVLPYPEFVRGAFVNHASLLTRLAHRAMSPLIGPVMRRQMDINPETAKVARAKTIAAMDRLENELQPSGYLVGDRFTVADLTAAALLSPIVKPPEFPYQNRVAPPPDFVQAHESLQGHRAFSWTLETYRRHRGKSAEVPAGTKVADRSGSTVGRTVEQ